MRTLKVVVIALGVLIVAAIVALVLKIADGAAPFASRAERSYPPSTVEIPRGAEVVATDVAGERLILHVRLANGDLRFVVVSLSTGKEIGSVDIREAPGKTL